MIEREIERLRRLCDPATWPKDYLIWEGEIYAFVSDDPLEEEVCQVLFRKFPVHR